MKFSKPFVSVLVPSYNRHELLVDTLKGLLVQNYQPLEIVVYDQSIDHPSEVEAFLKKASSRIRYITGESKGLVFAYRRCVDLARGDICLFIDDDVLIEDPTFISKHVANYSEETIGAVSGQVLHEGQRGLSDINPRAYGRYGWVFVRFDVGCRLDDSPSLCGANMSFRRVVYDMVGGFDLRYKGSGFRFETDFTFAVKKAGYRVVFDPEASLVHRYQQEGGADNRHLFSLRNDSHNWYMKFFANTWYFLRKWHSFPVGIRLLFRFWREHVFNRSSLHAGALFLIRRQKAFIEGIWLGQQMTNEGQDL